MAHRLAPQVEVELDDIWYYIARDSGSIEIADRLIDSITDRFFLLGDHPYVGRLRDDLRRQHHYEPALLRVEVEENVGQSATCELRA